MEVAGSKKTVMICDDEKDLLTLYQKALSGTYNVLAVESGNECIEKYINEKSKGTKIDLLLLDYRIMSMGVRYI